jgi:hypothetical protein
MAHERTQVQAAWTREYIGQNGPGRLGEECFADFTHELYFSSIEPKIGAIHLIGQRTLNLCQRSGEKYKNDVCSGLIKTNLTRGL